MITVSELQTIRMVRAMSIPLLVDGKPHPQGKERLVLPGQNVEMESELAARALEYGAARELTDEEKAAAEGPEEREGDEVNAGSASAKKAQEQAAADAARLQRPADDASYADWVAYAKQQGVKASGTKEEIQGRVADKEKETAADNGGN